MGTPDDGGRLPPRDLTGEQICTERDFREREGSAGRRATDDGSTGRRSRRRHWPEANFRTRRTGQRWNHRTTDGGRRVSRTTDDARRTTDDGFSRFVRREISERERGLRAKSEIWNSHVFWSSVFSSSMTKREKIIIFYYCHVGVLWRSCEADVYRSFLFSLWLGDAAFHKL